ncbi:MAG TPA: hypothetical protein ENI23_12580 [bacterium]|nr:hypothetical protein [bacterium]
MRVKREELVQKLESVLPGLATKPIIEQSQCFVFTDEKLVTFNDEVACSIDSPLDIQGAIPAKALLQLLNKLPEEEIEVRVEENELLIRVGKKKTKLRMEEEMTLPIEELEEPTKWRKIPKGLVQAINISLSCAGKDESQFVLTCIHIHPEWVEACDNFQVIRYPLKTGLKKSVLIKRDSLKAIVGLDMTEWSQTDNWTHFRNPLGLTLSCRRYLEDFPDLTKVLAIKGKPMELPKNIKDVVVRAEIFSSENTANDSVMVRMKSGKMEIKGEGPSGWYKEVKSIEYDGPPLAFAIAPKLLVEISSKSTSCQLGDTGLRVDGDGFTYVTCIEKVEEKDGQHSSS